MPHLYTFVDLGISSLTESDVSEEPKLREQLTMIPESVLAALTNIQRNQLRRVREDASNYLEDILRNVVKTVDVYYADQLTKELFVPPKKMIGDEGLELLLNCHVCHLHLRMNTNVVNMLSIGFNKGGV